MTGRATADQRLLAARLDALSAQLTTGYRPPADSGHRFEQSGWLALRAAVLVISGGDRAYRLAGDWAARGFPPGSTGPLGHASGLTSVEWAAGQSDEWDRRQQHLAALRQQLEGYALAIESEIAYTIRVEPNQGRRSTLVDCVNPHCNNVMTGLGEDRPRQGRCPRCYTFRHRNRRDWTPNGIDTVTTPNPQVTT